jgi:hypothetical protein
VGIACSAECCVLDVDPRHGGDITLALLEQKHGPLPVTWTAKTGGGGAHYFFRSATVSRRRIGVRSFDGVAAAVEDCAEYYRRNAMRESSVYIEVWTEKEALSAMLT